MSYSTRVSLLLITRPLLSIWDWRRRAIVAAFNNGNPKGTSITSLSFINEDTGGLLLAGSADGMVRLYRNYDPVYEDGKLELVSAWRALSVMTKVTRRAGLITDWNQNLARLLVGGDSDNINCWDAVRECVVFVSLIIFEFSQALIHFAGSQYERIQSCNLHREQL